LKWCTDAALVKAWGAWLARLHKASKSFVAAHPDVAKRTQPWTDIHDGLMRGWEKSIADGGKLVEEDVKESSLDEGGAWLVTHGDCNISNFNVVGMGTETPQLHVYDWDQAHLGFPEWDAAQCCLVVLMLKEGGMVGTKTPVPEADLDRFVGWFFEGYESEGLKINRPRFDRMLALRKAFHGAFAIRAASEATTPEGMKGFLAYVDGWANAGKRL
jgi:Ser/Thr protein kinase RdoA (MazF antagonist)